MVLAGHDDLEGTSSKITAEKEGAEIDALVAQDRQEFRLVSGGLMDLPSGKAHLAVYEHTFKGFRMKTAEVHIICGGWRFWMPFNALAVVFDKHFPAYLNCLKTFAPLGRPGSYVCN